MNTSRPQRSVPRRSKRGVGQRDAGFQLAAGLLGLPAAFQLGLLHAAVHAQRFPGSRRLGAPTGTPSVTARPITSVR